MGSAEKVGRSAAWERGPEALLEKLNACLRIEEELRQAHAALEEQLKDLPARLREKEILLREVHHRVNNNLQVILSLFQLQLQQVQDPKAQALLVESQNRIYAMALIHEKLYRAANQRTLDFGEYIGGLTAHILRSHGVTGSQVEVAVEAEEIAFSIQTMIPCGLIVNELLSNALKYAFPNGQPGCIRIQLQALPDHRYRLVVHDNGVGLPSDLDIGHTDSLGFQIVAALSEQLGGDWQRSGPPGTTVAITFQEPKTSEGSYTP